MFSEIELAVQKHKPALNEIANQEEYTQGDYFESVALEIEKLVAEALVGLVLENLAFGISDITMSTEQAPQNFRPQSGADVKVKFDLTEGRMSYFVYDIEADGFYWRVTIRHHHTLDHVFQVRVINESL